MAFDADGHLTTLYDRGSEGFELGVFRDGEWHHRTTPDGIEGEGTPEQAQLRIDQRDRIHLAFVWRSKQYRRFQYNLMYRRLADGKVSGSSVGLPSAPTDAPTSSSTTTASSSSALWPGGTINRNAKFISDMRIASYPALRQ
jgi:hypothetical protein